MICPPEVPEMSYSSLFSTHFENEFPLSVAIFLYYCNNSDVDIPEGALGSNRRASTRELLTPKRRGWWSGQRGGRVKKHPPGSSVTLSNTARRLSGSPWFCYRYSVSTNRCVDCAIGGFILRGWQIEFTLASLEERNKQKA